MEKSATWVKEVALLDTGTLLCTRQPVMSPPSPTQTPEQRQRQQRCSRRPEVNRHLCRHTSAVHQATASRHTCHASRRRFTRHGHGRAYGAAYRSPGIGCKRFRHLFVCRTIRAWSRWAVVLKPSANLRRNDILKGIVVPQCGSCDSTTAAGEANFVLELQHLTTPMR